MLNAFLCSVATLLVLASPFARPQATPPAPTAAPRQEGVVENPLPIRITEGPRPDWTIYFSLGISLALLIATCATLRVIWQQTVQTRRAADAGMIAAVAAKANTDALIASERAWLVVELIPMAKMFANGRWYRDQGYLRELNDEEILGGLHYTYEIRASNVGRTPARISKLQTQFSCGPRSEAHTARLDRVIVPGERLTIDDVNIDDYMRERRKQIDELKETATFSGQLFYELFIDRSREDFAPYMYSFVPSKMVLERAIRVYP